MEKKAGNYKILKQQIVFDSEKLKVAECQIRLPNKNIVSWFTLAHPGSFVGIPIIDDKWILINREWRLGQKTYVTAFTGAHTPYKTRQKNLLELKRELQEEFGITGGKYTKLVSFAAGIRLEGNNTYFLVRDFTLGKKSLDADEFLENLKLPVKGLYQELLANHIVSGDTLLIARLLEEKFSQ